MSPRKDPTHHAAYVTRHEQELSAEAERFHAAASGAPVEVSLVDAGDGELQVVMTAKGARRESYPMDGEGLATWLRAKLATHCQPRKRGTP